MAEGTTSPARRRMAGVHSIVGGADAGLCYRNSLPDTYIGNHLDALVGTPLTVGYSMYQGSVFIRETSRILTCMEPHDWAGQDRITSESEPTWDYPRNRREIER